jgi:hypothetical protein
MAVTDSKKSIGLTARCIDFQTGEDKEKGIGAFRFWTDARRFKGSEGKCIVQKALFESGVITLAS